MKRILSLIMVTLLVANAVNAQPAKRRTTSAAAATTVEQAPKLPKNPSFSLEFLISFCISSKNWLNANEENILVIHDDLTINDGNIFYLISTIITYNNNNNKNKNEIKEPMDIYINFPFDLILITGI